MTNTDTVLARRVEATLDALTDHLRCVALGPSRDFTLTQERLHDAVTRCRITLNRVEGGKS